MVSEEINSKTASKLSPKFTFRNSEERLIVSARLALAVTSLVAISLDSLETHYANIVYIILVAYLGYAILQIPISWRLIISQHHFLIITHCLDLVVFTPLIVLTEGPSSPFFVFFVFSLFCAALRWGQLAILWTALTVIGIFIGIGLISQHFLHKADFELNRFIIRSVYLMLVSLFLWYFMKHEQRIRFQLSKFAAWSSEVNLPHAEPEFIQNALMCAAKILETPRMLMIWEEYDEPFRFVAYYSPDEFYITEESPTTFEPLVAELLADSEFLCWDSKLPKTKILRLNNESLGVFLGSSLNPSLQARFRIKSVIACILSGEIYHGRLLFLDKPEMTSDDLFWGQLATRQVAATMDQLFFQRKMKKDAIIEQRLQVARDLHDSLLQNLTGVALQLETARRLMKGTPSATVQQLEDIQAVIFKDQQALRSFIEQLKLPTTVPISENLNFHERIKTLTQRIRQQWPLTVEYSIGKVEHVPENLLNEIYHLTHEALINTARHAVATHATIAIKIEQNQVHLHVQDNGKGFAFSGRYDLPELIALELGPKSLKDRVAKLKGQLVVISDSPGGAIVDISLPLSNQGLSVF